MNEPWSRVTVQIVDGSNRLWHVVRYTVDGGLGSKLFLAAALVWLFVVPWRTSVVLVPVTGLLGWLIRTMQVRRARRRLPEGDVITFRASPADIDALPFEDPPLLSATRECVVMPAGDELVLSAVADWRRELVCSVSLAQWTCSIDVDKAGRARTIHLDNDNGVTIRRLALGCVPSVAR